MSEQIDKFYKLARKNDNFRSLNKAFKKNQLDSDLYKANVYAHINNGENHWNLINEVAETEKPILVKILLKYASKPIDENVLNVALQNAVVHGNRKTTLFLLKYGVVPTIFVVDAAISNARITIFEDLVKYVDIEPWKKKLNKEVQHWVKFYDSYNDNYANRKLMVGIRLIQKRYFN